MNYIFYAADEYSLCEEYRPLYTSFRETVRHKLSYLKSHRYTCRKQPNAGFCI